MLAWEKAIDDGKVAFLQSIRRLDLPDYANLDELVLEAEDEPLGDYVLDLYDLHFHAVLEGNETLVRTTRSLSSISWADYPPPQFMPTTEVEDMMDGALFENEARTRVETEAGEPPRLGDVFLAPQPIPSLGEGTGETASPASRYAYVVLSQACDLRHGDTMSILLLRGTLRPYSAGLHSKNQSERTPIMKDGETKYAIEWDLLSPETWHIDSLASRLAEGYRRVRRFRTPFALRLQQAFLGRLGRVGTLTATPARYPVGAEVDVRYDPKDASQAVLETGFSGGGCMIVLVLGLLALAYFVAMHN